MDQNDKLRIRGNFRYIVGQIRVGDIRDYLFEKGILTEDDFEELDPSRRTERNNVRTLLNILLKRGPNAYRFFCEALRECDYEFVVRKLEDTDPQNVHIENQDELDSFLKEEGQLAELQRRLWKQTEMLEHYKREVDEMRAEHEELKTSKDDLRSRYDQLESQIKTKGMKEEYIIECLVGYMAKAQQDTIDSGRMAAVDWPHKPSSPMQRRSGSKDEIGRIAIQLSRDVVDYMSNSETPDKIPPEPNRYAKVMRRSVSMLIERQADTFQDFIVKLSFSDTNGFDMLNGVADEMLRVGENNWGRVVALYAFGGFVAKHAMKNKMHSITNYIGDYLGKYVARNMSDWIERKGGWDDFEEFFSDKNTSMIGWKSLFFTSIGLATLVSLASVKGSL